MENKNDNDKRICRAAITPSENEGYDFEAVAVPIENGQIRYSYENDEYFNQVLRTGRENIDTARLDSGLPLFDNHPYDQSAMNILGITVGYEFTERGLVIRGKFGARADDKLKEDVKNGIVRSVSIEGEVFEYEKERTKGQIPTYYAKRWQPYSLSFAPVPNDIGAQIEVKRKINDQIEQQSKQYTEKQEEGLFKNLANKFKG